MSSIGFKLSTSKRGMKSVAGDMDRAMASALHEEAHEIMTDSKTNYVPVLTGNLRLSGFVGEPDMTRNGVEVEIGFGAPGTPAERYAEAVHEAPPSVGQGKSKYLEKPTLAALPGFGDRIRRRMAAKLK